MTSKDLANIAVPYLRPALERAEGTIKDHIGLLPWLALKPGWWVVKGPALPLLTRIGIEIGIGTTASKLGPILNGLNAFFGSLSQNFITDWDKEFLEGFTKLVNMSRAEMLPECRETLAATMPSPE